MNYGIRIHEYKEGWGWDSPEEVAETNAFNLEAARIRHWHQTFNAAITGLSPVVSIAEAIEQATVLADRVHGCLQQ